MRWVLFKLLRQHNFSGTDADQVVAEAFIARLLREELPSRHVDPSDPHRPPPLVLPRADEPYRQQVVVLVRVQERLVDERAGRDDARDAAVERGLRAGRHGAHELLAEGDEARVLLHERLEVLLEVDHGEAAHEDAVAVPDPGGELDVEQARDLVGLGEVGLGRA